jgi:dipeptidyl-peptidase 4
MSRFLSLLAVYAFSPACADERTHAPNPEIILHQASAAIFPESWRGGSVNAGASPLPATQAERLRSILGRALSKYPPSLLDGTLRKIYGLGHLEYRGVATGGTRSASSIYVVCKPHYTDTAVERIVHAEYSSILFRRFSKQFDTESWQRQNPPAFKYLGGGVAAIKAGKASGAMDPGLLEQGFTSEYAQASMEEDFNGNAAPLLMGDAAYWAAMEKYPRIKAKAELVMSFYEKLDGSFTRAKFSSLRTTSPSLALESVFTDKAFEEEKLETVRWSKLGAHYFTLEKPAEGKLGKDLVRHDAVSGEKKIMATAKELTPKDTKSPLSVTSLQFNADESLALLFTNTKKVWRNNTRGDYWALDLKTKQLRKLGGDAAASTLMYAKFSPDGTRVAYMRKNNLHAQNLADLKVTAVTSDGSETLINGGSDWVNEEELNLRDGFRWSKDGSRLLFWQFDTKDVKKFWLVNQTDGVYQTFTTFPYPKAGEKNSATRLGIVSANGGAVTWLMIEGDPREHYLPFAEWTPDGKTVLVQQFNRLQNTLRVMLADPATGEMKTLLTETDKAWVENKNTEPRWAGDRFVWLSERSGWRHAYLVSLAGDVKPITKGDFDVIEVTAVTNAHLDFLASPENATQRYLYRVNLDGSELKRLSPADQPGTHSYDMSHEAKFAIHTYSTMTTPPVVSLVSLPDHQNVRVLKPQTALMEKLARLKLPKTEFLRVDIGDGIMADAWMMRDSDFDIAKKQPLLMNVYGEPAGQTVKDAWGGQKTLWHWMLAQQGYVVASVDTRGTPAPKGRDWRKAVYRQLGIMNSREQAAAARSLLARFDFLDAQRVGIWGWSGGGSSSLDAIFRHPDLYRAAIAIAPVADRRLYDSIYEERYMGLPKDNARGYTDGSPITQVKGLKGDLLIIHGTGDDNVHYQGTEKLINELVAQNKRFTVMPYPNRDHSINTGKGISRHLYELMTDWLDKHLMKADEPSKP